MFGIDKKYIDRLDVMAQEAIDIWGPYSQYDMAREETTEFLLELARIPRNRHNHDAILEESVDTFIMMTEMFKIYGPEKVNAMFEKKLEKFGKHLDNAKAKIEAERQKVIREQQSIANAYQKLYEQTMVNETGNTGFKPGEIHLFMAGNNVGKSKVVELTILKNRDNKAQPYNVEFNPVLGIFKDKDDV